MNAALMLMASWAIGADPPPAAPVIIEVMPAEQVHVIHAEPMHVRPSCWDWLKHKLKCQDCGHHIHCEHPGVIPNTEHPTLCQRIKDWCCRHKHPAPPSCVGVVVHDGKHASSSPLPYSMFGAYPFDHEPHVIAMPMEMNLVGVPVQTHTSLKPTEAETLAMPRKAGSPKQAGPEKVPLMPRRQAPEKLELMPVKSPAPASPARFEMPRALDLDPAPR